MAKSTEDPKKPNLSIQNLRETLGNLTQSDLAALIGISRDTVASWESGRDTITIKMAKKISWRTGVDPRCLLKGDGALRISPDTRPWKPSDCEEIKPYTRDDFIAVSKQLSKAMDNVGVQAVEHLVFRMIDCIGAAIRAETGEKHGEFSQLCDCMNEAFDGIERKFRLQRHLNEMGSDRSWKLHAPKWLFELRQKLIEVFITFWEAEKKL